MQIDLHAIDPELLNYYKDSVSMMSESELVIRARGLKELIQGLKQDKPNIDLLKQRVLAKMQLKNLPPPILELLRSATLSTSLIQVLSEKAIKEGLLALYERFGIKPILASMLLDVLCLLNYFILRIFTSVYPSIDPSITLQGFKLWISFLRGFCHWFTSVPSVTSSGKVWCSPGYAAAQMSSTAKGFEPTLRLSGSDGDYTAERLRRAIQAEGFQIVDPDAPDIASGRGWAEFLDDIDSDGHKKGVRLAEEAPRHIAKLARTIERLLSAGWQKVRVVTDHGWILMPGGLQKVELHSKLAETKWARCAVVKDSAVGIETITMPWSYGPEVSIALAPGIGAFKSGQVYDHGGLTLQECVVPMLDIVAQPAAQGRPGIKAVQWNSRKTICKLETEFAEGATFIVERLGNAVGEAGVVDVQGNAQVVFDEVDDLIDEFVLVVLRRDGMKISELQIKFGEVWNATR